MHEHLIQSFRMRPTTPAYAPLPWLSQLSKKEVVYCTLHRPLLCCFTQRCATHADNRGILQEIANTCVRNRPLASNMTKQCTILHVRALLGLPTTCCRHSSSQMPSPSAPKVASICKHVCDLCPHHMRHHLLDLFCMQLCHVHVQK